MSTVSDPLQATRRPVVLLAEKLAPSAVALLGDDVEIRHVDGTDRPALLAALADADALLVRSATKVDAEALAAANRLKVVARAGVGLDNVDVPAATARGVMVVNAPTSNIVSAAEHAVALLLATARHIPAADASLRAGQWKRSAYTGVELNGKTLGVDLGRRPDEQRVGIGEGGEQRGPVRPVDVADLDVVAEQCDRGRRELLGEQDDRAGGGGAHGGSWFGCEDVPDRRATPRQASVGWS